jgi:hypothetical protein
MEGFGHVRPEPALLEIRCARRGHIQARVIDAPEGRMIDTPWYAASHDRSSPARFHLARDRQAPLWLPCGLSDLIRDDDVMDAVGNGVTTWIIE